MNTRILLLACILASFYTVGCREKINPEQGFTMKTADRFVNGLGQVGPPIPRPFDPVSGDFRGTKPGDIVGGSKTVYNETTDSSGSVFISNVKAPAFWDHFVTFNLPCGTRFLVDSSFGRFTYKDPNFYTSNLGKYEWDCFHSGIPLASTRLAVQDSMPSTLTLWTNGQPFTTTYGMPVLYLYNPDASIAASAVSTSIASDGSSATFPFPTLPSGTQLPANLYGETLLNRNASGGFDNVDFNILSIASHRTLNTPFGVAAGWSYSSYYYSYTSDPYNDGTCAGQSTYTSG